MAFLVRTKRETSVHHKNTPSEVGPGAYDSARGEGNRISYAPFASSAERGIEVDATIEGTPGAGEYQPVYRPSPSAAVSTTNFVSRVPRFTDPNTTLSPGPGAYKGNTNTWVKPKPRPRVQKRGNVQWVKVHKAPSIPSHKQSYGYEENKEGELILQHPPSLGHTGETRDMVGVGEYFPEKSFNFGSTGTDFGRRSDRSYKKTPSYPGPGAYNFDFKLKKKLTQSSSFRSKVKRTSLADERPNPGPGHYNEGVRALSAFSPKAVSPASNRYQSFGSSVQRGDIFVTKEQRVVPGPGQYEDKLHATSDPDEALIAQAKASFNQKSARFADVPPDYPGPGRYEQTPENKKNTFGRNQTFMGTTKRFDKLPANAAVPGPGSYTEKKLVAPIKESSVFNSKTGRFFKEFSTKTPAAAEYNPDESLADKVKRSGDHVSSTFQSRVKRSDMTNLRSFKDLYKKGLGPGAYADHAQTTRTRPNQGASTAAMKSANPRFMESMSANSPVPLPCPGHYDRDATKSKLLKRSYNITVGI